jgi:SAM-dependent methyltransferase
MIQKRMNPEQEYFDMNRQAWNLKTEVHLRSDFYRHDAFLKGASSLNPIECHLLGDLDQRSVLHLQCHFGQDTLSLERLGAQVTGVDLSDSAIDTARATATDLGSSAEFICCNLYDLPQHLNRTFDLVFTSYGTIGWLPDLKRWAAVVSHFLKPGGRFIMVDFHPVVWMFDNQFGSVAYRYFNSGPIIETEQGTYELVGQIWTAT